MALAINASTHAHSVGEIKNYEAFRHVKNVFIQGFLFIHPRFVFIVQPIRPYDM